MLTEVLSSSQVFLTTGTKIASEELVELAFDYFFA